jgi:cation diffusion facilitator CzcD-associated flavoprotein CzcO
MSARDMNDLSKWCVIGAGPSGLTALKNLLHCNIEAECLEREDDLGGNWYFGSSTSRVFESTRLISSKSLTEFTDFPMPREWPAYPDHRQCLDYLHRYSDHFGLRNHILFQKSVAHITPLQHHHMRTGWCVELEDGTTRNYAGLIFASGHNHEPRIPDIVSDFSGPVFHSADYKSPDVPYTLKNQRVLVIGGGNSGCDIAVESSHHATSTFHSTRRSYHILPRLFMSRPSDLRGERLLKMGMPLWLRRSISRRVVARTIGLPEKHGLSYPDHNLWETHPIINDNLYERIDKGALHAVPDIARFEGDTAVFADGRHERIDVVIAATGYRLTFPKISILKPKVGHSVPELFMHFLYPEVNDIAVVGMIQPDSGQWGITDLQSQVIARMILADRRAPRAKTWLQKQRQRSSGDHSIRYIDSPRHELEVEHFSYSKRLKKLIAGMNRRLRHAPA